MTWLWSPIQVDRQTSPRLHYNSYIRINWTFYIISVEGKESRMKVQRTWIRAPALTLPGHVWVFCCCCCFISYSLSLTLSLTFILSLSLSFLPPLFLYLSLSFSLAASPLCSHSGLWRETRTISRILTLVYIQITKTWPTHIKTYFTDSTQGHRNKINLLMMHAFFIRWWELGNHPIAIFALASRNLRTKFYIQPY